MRPSIVAILVLLACATASAQAPYLVKDLGNPGSPTPQSSGAWGFFTSGATMFFNASTESTGGEPWVSDAGGIRLLRDINPGQESSGVLFYAELTPGVVLFAANDGLNGLQLWRSDGTTAGTTLVKIVNGSTATFAIRSPSYGGKVYFAVNDGVHGREPWVSDGTADGTVMLADTWAGNNGDSNPIQFFRLGSTTFFFGPDGIWTTDGTPAGTTLAIPLVNFRLPCQVVGNLVYFVGYDAAHGYELWKSDGTVAGTAMVADIRAGAQQGMLIVSMATAGNRLVFFADDGSGARLWTTDGTAANTTFLTAYPPVGVANYTRNLSSTSKGVFFGEGNNIWRSDGTEAGTYIAATMAGESEGFVDAFSKIYFTSYVGHDSHLFQFDGSQGATPVEVRSDVTAGGLTPTGGKLWFPGTDANGTEPWVSEDGTHDGTHLAANIAVDPARSSNPHSLVAVGPRLYFVPSLPNGQVQRSDGTSGGTFAVTSLDNVSYTDIRSLTPYHGDLYFRVRDTDLYRVDGTAGGQTLFTHHNFIDELAADDHYLYFWQTPAGDGLHRTDGTPAGTIRLYDPSEPADRAWGGISVVPWRGSAWVFTFNGLYRTDGTVASTRHVLTLPTLNYPFENGTYVPAGGFIYARAIESGIGSELWRTDGTPAGTGIVKDLNPGPDSSQATDFTAAGPLVYFTAYDPDHGRELWRSDGTAAGTYMVKDIRPGTATSTPSALAVMNGVLYFSANDGTHGIELWKSDGTEAGTMLVRDIVQGSFSANPTSLTAVGGKVWFAANDGLHGSELWSSDGTENGTAMVADIFGGSGSSLPDQFTAVESTLFFTAMTDDSGRELWAIPLTTGYVSIADASTVEGNGGAHALRFTVTRHGVTSGAASVDWSSAGITATAGSDFVAGSGTVSFAAGETTKTIDVAISGDSAVEDDERLLLQLATPVGVALQNASAVGTIENDDLRADLAVEIVQTSSASTEASRTIKVTNNGPSSAYGVTVDFTESPYEFSISAPSNPAFVTCTPGNPTRCTIPFVQGGTSTTFTLNRFLVAGIIDPALPPGRTLTASVSSAIADLDPSNNTTSRMTTGNGNLILPAFLVVGENATATFALAANATSATDVTLTSSSGSVTVTPPTARIEAGQRTATFALGVNAGAASTLLTATIAAATKASLVVPIVAAGQTPKLDVAVVQHVSYIGSAGELMIPIAIAARMPDQTLPTGLATLLDENGATLAQLTLDSMGAATFARPSLPPGDYHFRLRYEGDARFNTVTVALKPTTVQKTTPTVVAPTIATCANSFTYRVTFTSTDPNVAPPTGTVKLTAGLTEVGTYTLAATGAPGQSAIAPTLNFANGLRLITADYSGDPNFNATSTTRMTFTGCEALNLVATATSSTSVALTWNASAPNVTAYAVYRSESVSSPLDQLTATSALSFVDSSAQPGHVYVYRVRAVQPSEPNYLPSPPDIASTFAFTDNPLTAGTLIKSAHLAELRAMTSALRQVAALPPLAFTGSIAAGNVVDFRHVAELRQSIDTARALIGVPAINWTQPNATSGASIRAATLQELREAVR